jgi:MFS family permease
MGITIYGVKALRQRATTDQALVAADERKTSGAVRRYCFAASTARTADEGVAPALALLVAASGREPVFAGVLLAGAGLPHVVSGPLTGAALDTSRHRRTALALAPVVLGLALAGTALGLGHVPDALCVALVAVAGCFGPLLTGGLSAELTQLVPGGLGRALALDGASYNVASIAGPGAVAACAALAGAQAAALCLGALALGAAAMVLRLPPTRPQAAERRTWRDGLGGARRLWDARPLRAVTAGTTLAFLGAGALPLLVVARAQELGSATAGAAVLAAMAVAALAGALLIAARQQPGARPEARIVVALLVVAAALALAGAGPGLAALTAGLVLAGVADGTLLPAVLVVRTEHSSPEERGAVFMTAASVKVAAGAAGTAAGGVLVTATGAGTALLAAAGLHLAGALLCLRYRAAS